MVPVRHFLDQPDAASAPQVRNLVVTLGEDDAAAPLQSTAAKVWDADRLRLQDKDAAPPLLRTVKLFAPKFPESVARPLPPPLRLHGQTR